MAGGEGLENRVGGVVAGELAGGRIDARVRDAFGNRELANRLVEVRLAHEIDPDRKRGAAAGLALAEIAAHVETEPRAGGDVGREADEPAVAVIVGGARLAGERAAEHARLRGRAARVLDRRAQQIGDQEGVAR